MKALFVYSNKYERCDGIYYSITQTSDVWRKRYLNIFSELEVVGRVIDVEKSEGKKISNTNGVTFRCTKIGINAIDYFLKRKKIINYIDGLVKNVDFVIARQSFFGAIAAECARKQKKPYVVEIVGSSWDANWNYSFKGKIVAPYFEFQTKRMVKKAKYVIYVTKEYLQKEYHTNGKTIAISNVEIERGSDSIIEARLKRISKLNDKCLSLCTVAAVDVKYKGQQYVLRAMKSLINNGYNLKYYIVGGGSQLRLKKIAKDLGLTDYVVFTGAIKKDEVLKIMDEVDIYIQPSLQEGLPRAMIEAMSRGLMCIGFKTAGIPELIEKDYLCKRKDWRRISKIIKEVSNDMLKTIAKRNFEESQKYSFEILNKRRKDFFELAIENK